MGSGPGNVERALRSLVADNPQGAWTTTEICRRVYGIDRAQKKHRVAVLRTMRRIIESTDCDLLSWHSDVVLIADRYSLECYTLGLGKTGRFPPMESEQIAKEVQFNIADRDGDTETVERLQKEFTDAYESTLAGLNAIAASFERADRGEDTGRLSPEVLAKMEARKAEHKQSS